MLHKGYRRPYEASPLRRISRCPRGVDYLIPTVVTIPSAPEAKITYPRGQVFKPKFSPEGESIRSMFRPKPKSDSHSWLDYCICMSRGAVRTAVK